MARQLICGVIAAWSQAGTTDHSPDFYIDGKRGGAVTVSLYDPASTGHYWSVSNVMDLLEAMAYVGDTLPLHNPLKRWIDRGFISKGADASVSCTWDDGSTTMTASVSSDNQITLTGDIGATCSVDPSLFVDHLVSHMARVAGGDYQTLATNMMR